MFRMNDEDWNELLRVQEGNARALELAGRYLTRRAGWVSAADMDAVTSCGVTEEQAYIALMTAGMGLDEQDNPEDRRLSMDWFWPSVKMLDPTVYRNDPYFRHIRVPEKTVGRWQLTHLEYAPYEAFVRDDVRVMKDMREIPQIGFFEEKFTYPAVLENGREWMTVTPNEVETMKAAIAAAEGEVIEFGLGLGYFAYMASEKEDVRRVTIVERDGEVISLFREELLKQFPHGDKIEIIRTDAFEYVDRSMDGRVFDVAFVDLWHDVSDGIGLYLKMKGKEENFPGTRFLYWIERSLLSRLRFELFWSMAEAKNSPGDEIWQIIGPEGDMTEVLSDENLRKLAEKPEAMRLIDR